MARGVTKFFKITFVQYRGELHMPRWVKYFCDEMHQSLHALQTTRNKAQVSCTRFGLGTVYEEAKKRPLVGHHNALIDCRGQLELCACGVFFFPPI